MISKKDILNMARKVTKRSRGKIEHKAVNPYREWLIGVLFFIIIAVVGGILNARNYVYYNTLELRVTDTTTPIETYKTQAAAEALTIYNERLTAFNALANTAPVPVVIDEVSTSTATSSEEVLGDENVQNAVADVVEDEVDDMEDVDEVVDTVVAEEESGAQRAAVEGGIE